MWLRFMLLAFLLNGIGSFGLRVLVAMGAGDSLMQYISTWYAAGCIFMAALYFARDTWPNRSEVAVSFVMGLCSVLGTLGLGFALQNGVAGFVVYPIALGGGVFIVMLCGVLFCKESMSGFGKAGAVLGLAALIVLAVF